MKAIIKIDIKKKDDEYCVRWIENGKRIEAKCYYTDDKEDANETAKLMKIEVGKALKKLELKTFNESDWDCFAGANGDNPKICWDVDVDKDSLPIWIKLKESISCYLIVDEVGIVLDVDDLDGNTMEAYYLDVKNQYLGEIIANGLKYPIDYNELMKLGFKAC